MLVGRFGGTTSAPFMEGRIWLFKPQIVHEISFLVDTGAHTSIIMPSDGLAAGVDYTDLRFTETSNGVGGELKSVVVEGMINFVDSDFMYCYQLKVQIAQCHEYLKDVPSIIGRDILSKWDLRVSPLDFILTGHVKAQNNLFKL